MTNKYKSEDYLQECLDSIEEDLSIEAFQKACCSICLNNECKRSGWGDSNWLQRMKRQENSLYNPTFYDPGEYEELASQDFITIDNDQSKVYGGWVNVKEDGTIIHHAEEETKEHEADKVDQSVQSLRGGENPDEEGREGEDHVATEDTKTAADVESDTETEEPVPETGSSEPDPADRGEVRPEPKQKQKTEEVLDTKPVRPKHFRKNTESPKEGIMLGGKDAEDARRQQRPESELLKKSRKWEVSEADKNGGDSKDGGGHLTVRIDNGEVVDKD